MGVAASPGAMETMSTDTRWWWWWCPVVEWAQARGDTVDDSWLGIGTGAVIVAAWLVGVAPFTLLDAAALASPRSARLRRWAERFRVQGGRWPPREHYVVCAKMVAVNLCVIVAASAASGGVLARVLQPVDAPTPPVATLLLQLALFFVVDDLCFYAYHRAFHNVRAIYTRVHKPHHLFTVPFAATSHATHPLEMAAQAVGSTLAPALWPGGTHPAAFWVWLVVRQWQGIEDHCGYEFPWLSPSALLPGWLVGGSAFHDAHHARNVGNFASCFSCIDRLFGTAIPTEEERAAKEKR